jgi:hypothetical protein
MCDANNNNCQRLEEEYVMEEKYSCCIFRVSFISFLSSVYALYCGCYDLAAVPGSVFLTSVNYWRKPVYGWRRNLDMSCVALALTYQNYSAYLLLSSSSVMSHDSSSQLPALLTYYTLMGLGIGCYHLSVNLYEKKYIWSSTYVHCMVHVLANTANVLLYNRVGMGNSQRPIVSAPAFCPSSDAPFFRWIKEKN